MANRQLAKLTPKAEAIMDWMLAHPGRSHGECAEALGVTANWISIVVNSDVYRAEHRRRQEAIRERLEGQVVALAGEALGRVQEAMERSEDPYYALQVAKLLVPQVMPTRREEVRESAVGTVSVEIRRYPIPSEPVGST